MPQPDTIPTPAEARSQRSRQHEEWMAREVRAPLAALGVVLRESQLPAPLVQRALASLLSVGAATELLFDSAVPACPRPLACSLAEVSRAARNGLTPERRARVLLAVDVHDQSFDVDGPMLAGVLTRLLDEALASSTGDVLLHAGSDEEESWFGIVDERGGARLPSAMGWHELSASDDDSLPWTVAQRDVTELGGRIVRSIVGEARRAAVLVCVPCSSSAGSSAERGAA